MCIVALAWQVLDECPVMLISNRDEFYHREARPLAHWQDSPIYAGQDIEQGGTWLGLTEQGRWAVVTNYREVGQQQKFATSRGDLVKDFLLSELSPIRYMQALEQTQQDYAGFNLIVGDRQQAVYMSNRGEAPQVLAKGVYVVSNTTMSEHWQKTAHLRKRFTQELLPLMQLAQIELSDQLQLTWDILEDERKVNNDLLPDTGVGQEMEELLSSSFIRSPIYGTRCSNFLQIKNNKIDWFEKTQQGEHVGEINQLEIDIK